MLNFSDASPPKQTGTDAFNAILPTIKAEILKSRKHWDLHEPKMWARAKELSDEQLSDFTIEQDLVEVSYNAEIMKQRDNKGTDNVGLID